MKKLILPLVILAGLGIGAYLLFGKKKAELAYQPGYALPGTTPISPTIVTPVPYIPGKKPPGWKEQPRYGAPPRGG